MAIPMAQTGLLRELYRMRAESDQLDPQFLLLGSKYPQGLLKEAIRTVVVVIRWVRRLWVVGMGATITIAF